MTFAMCLGAYVLGWILCNVFLYQVANRIDHKYNEKRRTELCEQVASFVVEKLKQNGGAP